MSYHSTAVYYQRVNAAVAARLGGHRSAPLIIGSVDFQTVRDFQTAEDWDGAGEYLADWACRLEKAGAEGLLIATNLMHKVAPAVEAAIAIPLLHIADTVAAAARGRGLARLGLLGTAWTMREDFYADRLARHGIEVIRAADADADLADDVIFGQLTQGQVTLAARAALLGITERLGLAGAEGVVLGCTELDLVLSEGASPLPLIDSTAAHTAAAAAFVLGEEAPAA
jgi:aspartate racemase